MRALHDRDTFNLYRGFLCESDTVGFMAIVSWTSSSMKSVATNISGYSAQLNLPHRGTIALKR
jgi:hypothetical protein